MKIVQARIDATPARLRRETGMTHSQLIREGLEPVSQRATPVKARRVRRIGRFTSGQSDLGSNKTHLSGFGKS